MRENSGLTAFIVGLQAEGDDVVDMIDEWPLAALLAFLLAFYTRHGWHTQKAMFDVVVWDVLIRYSKEAE